jgi:hypothetical protein
MDKNLLEAMTNVVNAIPNAVKSVGNDVENAIQNLNDDAKASHYIRILKAKLTNKAASILLRRMCQFYEGANLSENKEKQLFKSISDKAMNNPNILNSLSGELKIQVSKMMIEAGMSINPLPPRNWEIPPSDRSSSGESEDTSSSVGSDSSNNSGGSGASNSSVKSVLNTLRQLVSRRSDSTGKGSESQEDQKGPTKSPSSCTAGIKKALSSCCSYLYNGFKGMFETDTGRFIQRYKKMQSEDAREERREREAKEKEWERKGGGIRREQPKTERAKKNAVNPRQKSDGRLFSSLRGMWNRDITYDRFDTTVDMKNGVRNKWTGTGNVSMEGAYQSVKSAGIRAGTGGAILGLKGVEAARGLPSSLRRGGKVIGEFGASAVRFAVTDNGYGSSSTSTWAERFDGMRGLTEGMGSGYGPGSFIRDGANFLLTPGTGDSSLPSGSGVVKSVVRGGASAVGSMASMVQNARVTFPTIGPSR